MGTKVYDSALDLITFSRASGGTYLGSDGLLKTASTNIPRIEYAADGTVKGLLIEEQRTNIITSSEDFSAWGASNASITADALTSPSGTADATFLQENTALAQHYILKTWVTTATDYTLSVYAKAGGRSWIRLYHEGVANSNTWFDLSSGVVGTKSVPASVATIEDVGGGWYRCSVSQEGLAATKAFAFAVADADNSSSYTGDGTSGVYIYGAQLEAGSFATSYISTSGSAATRSADIASIPVSAFGYNENKTGTFLVDWVAPTGRSGRALSVTSSIGTGDRFADVYGVTGSRVDLYSNHTGGDLYNLIPYTDGVVNKIAFTMGENDAAACLNGGTVDTDTATGTPTATNYINFGVWAGSYLNGHIKSIQYYPRRLTNTQLQELTA